MSTFSICKYFFNPSLIFIVFGLVTVDTYKTFGDSRPNLNHEAYLTEVASISCIFGALRGVWSALLDRYSYKKAYGTLLCI